MVGLMIQLDDGARAAAKYKRIENYLLQIDDPFLKSRLHGAAALCAQVVRNQWRCPNMGR